MALTAQGLLSEFLFLCFHVSFALCMMIHDHFIPWTTLPPPKQKIKVVFLFQGLRRVGNKNAPPPTGYITHTHIVSHWGCHDVMPIFSGYHRHHFFTTSGHHIPSFPFTSESCAADTSTFAINS